MSLIGESRYLVKMGARSLEMVIISMTREAEVGNEDVFAGGCTLIYTYLQKN